MPPWDYLFLPFRSQNFPDIFHPLWIASLVLLLVLLVVYNVETRRLHRHPRHLEMWEWLLWTGLITFSLLIVESIFAFDFFLVVATLVIGLGVLAWVRFRKFPPLIAAYERGLARQRFFSREKFVKTETIRPKASKTQRRRRGRR